MKNNWQNSLGVLVETLFVFTLVITLAQLINYYGLKPALEGNPEPGGIIYSIFYGISTVLNYIWDKAGAAIVGLVICTGLVIVINVWLSHGKVNK